MRKYYILPALTLFGLLFMTSCGKKGNDENNDSSQQSSKEDFTGFEQTPTGIYYKVINHNPDTAKAFKFDRAIDFHLVVKNYKDSVLQNSYEKEPIKNFIYQPPRFKGDISEIMQYISEGDSVVIGVSSDSTAKYQGRPMPPTFPKGTYVRYFMKILKVKPAAEAMAEIEKAKTEALQKVRRDDSIAIHSYLKEKGLADKAKSTPSGLYYVITEEGTGERPEKHDTVYTNYVGKLTNGNLFDTNVEEAAKKGGKYQGPNPKKYQPFKFILGRQQVIRGWDEGLALLKKGSKAILLVPSTLGYGPRAMGKDIPANSTLVFDVELTDFKKGKAPKAMPKGHSKGDGHNH
ncbi:FKBP-type peptidyl-prolyl cis-trans isomerase [uncultured Microscilla sp.]|uniref:FKBP-type peptidyl-prolyl cis-trans isomerase n=1 Tax=uncultured Microscilla sp. TaxID=432653 RepID=UPI002620B68B|nr:FKBP-type peptidyl-prolyl cis-trans isomerase [uncultured Microscilla sp.]